MRSRNDRFGGLDHEMKRYEVWTKSEENSILR